MSFDSIEYEYIQRVRPKHEDSYLSEIYSTPHDHSKYGRDHKLRVESALMLASDVVGIFDYSSGADLSCGNGYILDNLNLEKKTYGDFAPRYDVCGPIEKTIKDIDNVDIFICSETIEHLDEPVETLRSIREKSKSLILSTPVEAWGDANPEHYWAWSRVGVELMFRQSGWKPDCFILLDATVFGTIYKFGIWSCL
jgi:hypothetical protein